MSAIYSSGYAIGLMILAGMAYGIRKWRMFRIALSALGCAAMLTYLGIPESPRWLFTRGRFQEAQDVLMSIANGNKKRVTEFTIRDHLNNMDKVDGRTATTTKKEHFIDLFRYPRIIFMTLGLVITFSTIAVTYMTTTLIAGPKSGDLFIGFAISGLVELPGDLIGAAIMTKLGRKRTVICALMLSGLVCLPHFFFTMPSFLMASSVFMSKACVGAAFAIAVVHVAELYPTSLRTRATSLMFFMISVFGMITPYIIQLGETIDGVEFLVLGVTGLTTAIFNMFVLPETSHKEMPESIQNVLDLFTSESKPKETAIQGGHDNLGYDEVYIKRNQHSDADVGQVSEVDSEQRQDGELEECEVNSERGQESEAEEKRGQNNEDKKGEANNEQEENETKF